MSPNMNARFKASARDPVEDAEERESRRADYFAGLPASLTAEEEVLRAALLEEFAESGIVRLSLVAQKQVVKDAKAAVGMPKGVGLGAWIKQRMSDEFTLVFDKTFGEPVLAPAGADEETVAAAAADAAEQNIEEFFATLPENEFSEAELKLREALLSSLEKSGGGAKLNYLVKGEHSRDLHQARSALLPKGMQLTIWLERRLGSEIRVSTDSPGGAFVELIGKAATDARRNGKGAGKEKGAFREKGSGKDKGAGKGTAGGKGALADRAVFRPSGFPAGTEEDAEAKALAKLQREEKVQAFLASLPDDRLLPEEQRFRACLLNELNNARGHTLRLSLICQTPVAKAAKAALLPAEVSVGMWIENRIGGEVLLDKEAGTGQTMASLTSAAAAAAPPPDSWASRQRAGPPAAYGGAAVHDRAAGGKGGAAAEFHEDRGERDAAMVEYFSGLGALSPVERKLRNALIENCKRNGAAQRLTSVINSDPAVAAAWQEAKASWMALKPPIEASFARWVELRVTEEVRITREPYVQLRTVKRGPPPTGSPQAPVAKYPRTDGAFKPTGQAIGSRQW